MPENCVRSGRTRLSGFIARLGGRRNGPPECIFVTQALPRITLVSTVVPPGAQGQAHVLGHLIGFPPPQNCLLLADQPPFPPGTALEGPFVNYRILGQQGIELKNKGWLTDRLPHLNSMVGVLYSVAMRAREISQHARAFKASVLIACTASPFDLPACTLVALRRKVPLVAYLFDDPIFQWPPGPLRNFARLWEPIWARLAAEVIVPNEAMAAKFTLRRGRKPVIVRNPVSPEAVSSASAWPTVPGKFRIVYTGSVYHAQSDAFLNLLGALKELDDWSLHIYTSQSEAQVAQYGIHGPEVFHHQHVNQTEAYAQQRSADVLFLPLAFHSTIQDVLRTSAPMKMGEYLASGRPILVHAPPDTFVADHIRRHRAGLVVDVPDSQALAKALREIAANTELRQSINANAVRLAQEYRVEQACDVFWATIRAVARETGRIGTPNKQVTTSGVVLRLRRSVRMRQRAKQIFARFSAVPRQLAGKFAFATIWLGVALHPEGTKWRRRIRRAARPVFILLPEPLRVIVRRNTHGGGLAIVASATPAKTRWKTRMRQQVKRALTRIPPVRVYLAEKYTLQDSWNRAAAERDALAVERIRLEAEVERQRIALDGIAVERDVLTVAREQLRAEVERQRVALEGVIAEREALVVERTDLRGTVERQRVALQTLASERDDLLSGRQDLLRHIEAVEAERNQLSANTIRLQTEHEKFQQERAQYQDAMLGKLAIVESQFNTFQRSIARLTDIPNGAVADELSRNLYLDLLEDSLIGTIMRDESIAPWHKGYDQTRRELGRDWPKFAFTMIGKARMRNLREMTETILSDGVPGDLLEAGVWRGGACIYMRGILKARGITDRAVWVADSFAGLPPPNAEQYPADKDDPHHTFADLAISLEEVRDNFSRFGLLDEQVRFLKGWFKDTLPQAPVKRLALLRLDGDMYEFDDSNSRRHVLETLAEGGRHYRRLRPSRLQEGR